MNGRIYDPLLGRFLSADPIIQAPANLQSYNRYSYVMNSPLGYVDPSGYTREEYYNQQTSFSQKRLDKFNAATKGAFGTYQTPGSETASEQAGAAGAGAGGSANERRTDSQAPQARSGDNGNTNTNVGQNAPTTEEKKLNNRSSANSGESSSSEDKLYESRIEGAELGPRIPWNENNPHFRPSNEVGGKVGSKPKTSWLAILRRKIRPSLVSEVGIAASVPPHSIPTYTRDLTVDGVLKDYVIGIQADSGGISDTTRLVTLFEVSAVQNGVLTTGDVRIIDEGSWDRPGSARSWSIDASRHRPSHMGIKSAYEINLDNAHRPRIISTYLGPISFDMLNK